MEDRNNPPDKERDIEENASTNDEDEGSGNHKNSNQGLRIKITKDNIINSRDLLFLRKDNVVYFVDTDGRPLPYYFYAYLVK